MNNTGSIRLIDDDFSESHTENSELLIKIGDGEFSFAVFDKDENRARFITFVEEGIETGFAKEPLLSARYSSVKIAFETFDFTFLPQELFTGSDIGAYSRFIQNPEDKRIIVTTQRASRIHQVAGIEKSRFESIHGLFNKPVIFTQADPLIEAALRIPSEATTLFLNFNTTTFEALIAERGNVRFYNIFKIETVDDFNYFLLLFIREHELKIQDLECFISGEIGTDDEYYNRLSKYFGQLKFPKMPENIVSLSPDIPEAFFFSLLGLQLCE